MSMYMDGETNAASTYYRYCWHTRSQIAAPSKAAVFVDEHENSITFCEFYINNPNPAPHPLNVFVFGFWTWVSFPAVRHNNGCNLSFADGHVETWHWQEPNTASIGAKAPWLFAEPAVPGTDRDLKRFFGAVPAQTPS